MCLATDGVLIMSAAMVHIGAGTPLIQPVVPPAPATQKKKTGWKESGCSFPLGGGEGGGGNAYCLNRAKTMHAYVFAILNDIGSPRHSPREYRCRSNWRLLRTCVCTVRSVLSRPARLCTWVQSVREINVQTCKPEPTFLELVVPRMWHVCVVLSPPIPPYRALTA